MGESSPDRHKHLVRFLNMALKESSERFGIRPDRQGYVSLMDLMGAILDEPDLAWVTVKDVAKAVGSVRPPVFEISGKRIRVLGRTAPRGAPDQAQDPGKPKRRRRRRKKSRDGAQPAQAPKKEEKKVSGEPKPAGKRKRRRRRKKKKQPGQHNAE